MYINIKSTSELYLHETNWKNNKMTHDILQIFLSATKQLHEFIIYKLSIFNSYKYN